VWTTKNRQVFLSKKVKSKVIAHIKENALTKDIYIDSIDGGKDHLHALISLGAKQSVSELAQLLKGEASFWINKEKLVKGKFEWQDKYFAVSVSESILPTVRKYIRNQEEHHRVKPFFEEYDAFIKKYGFSE
jgi:REP element-mobilizing transposase RayT